MGHFDSRGRPVRHLPDGRAREHAISGARADDRHELDSVFSATYEELRRLASRVRGDHPGATLVPTALVDEAWAKLGGAPNFQSTSLLHFKRIAARAMREEVFGRMNFVANDRFDYAAATGDFRT